MRLKTRSIVVYNQNCFCFKQKKIKDVFLYSMCLNNCK